MQIWKTLKIFLSSTFLDLELERDHLADVFYGLKQDLSKQRLSLIPYDLRWRERHSQDPIAKWCIEMLHQCQYFIGILGWRYGWRPDRDWHNQPNQDRISVTEMEIREAIATIPKSHRFFCIIAPDAPKTEASKKESPQDIASLDALKEWLVKSGETIFEYHKPDEVPALIEQKLRALLNQEYPSNTCAEPEQYTRFQALEEIIEQKVRGFIGRTKYLDEIQTFLQQAERNYLAIASVAGTGKSALLAKAIQQMREQAKMPVIAHFMSMSSDSRQVHGLMLNLAEQLQKAQILTQAIADDPVQLRMQIRNALEQSTQPCILAIDGIDEIEEDGYDLAWLSPYLPPHIKIILTIRPVTPWETLEKFPKLQPLQLPPLEDAEILAIMDHYRLALLPQDKELLMKRAQGNPLYLKVALEEILETGIAVGELANSIDRLFEQILQRLQKKYGAKMIEDYLGCIAASRAGLTELELQELLSQEELAQARLHLVDEALMSTTKSLENFLVKRGGLIAFFHPEFERTIKERLGKSGMRTYHTKLANYFQAKGFNYSRTLFELCYQQQWSQQYPEVLKLLTNLEFLEAKCNQHLVDDLVEDFHRALLDPVVPIPANLELQHSAAQIMVNCRTLELISKAIKLDIAFLHHHPEGLFQTLWNRCYWYDAPASAAYYLPLEEKEVGPWQSSGYKIYPLVEKWRTEKEARGKVWIKTCKPLEVSLDTPLLKVLRGHEGWVTSVAVSPNQSFVASGSHDETIRIWDMQTGECFKVLQSNHSKVMCIAFLEEKKLVAGLEDGSFQIWQLDPDRCLATIPAHSKPIVALAVDLPHQCLALGAKDFTISLWNLATQKKIRVLEGHTNEISALAFHPNGQTLASGSADVSIKIWDLSTGACTSTLMHHKRRVYSICFNPDGTKLASASRDDTAVICDTATCQVLRVFKRHKWGVLGLDFSPDGTKLLTASGDKSMILWDAETGQMLKTFRGHERSVATVKFSGNGKYFVSGSYDRSVCIWNAESQECSLMLKSHHEWARVSIFSPDGKYVVSGSTDRQIILWNTETGQFDKALTGHTGWVTTLAFSRDSHILASAGGDNTAKLWDMTTGNCIRTLEGHTEAILTSMFIHSDQWLITGSRDKTIRIWDVSTGECLRVLEGHENWVSSVDYHTSLNQIVSGSHDMTIRIWNPETGECLQVISTKQANLPEHEQHLRSVAFSKDGETIISCSRAQEVIIWNKATSQVVQKIPGDVEAHQMAYVQKVYPINQGLWTALWDAHHHTVAVFPELLSAPKIFADHQITGVSQGSYVYLLELRGV